MIKKIKLIDNLNNNLDYSKSCELYCIAIKWHKFGTSEFIYNLHRRLCDYMNYNFLDLSKGQKSYISRLTNILVNPHYFYYFVKKWVMPLDYVEFIETCKRYQK